MINMLPHTQMKKKPTQSKMLLGLMDTATIN